MSRRAPVRERDADIAGGIPTAETIGATTSATPNRRTDLFGSARMIWLELPATMIAYPFVFDTERGRFMLYNGGRYGAGGFGIAVLDQDRLSLLRL
jgi:hypothetical protein